MTGLERTIHSDQRTRGGAVSSRNAEFIRTKLLAGGFVLLPSDTCYSVAMIPWSDTSRSQLNDMLGRPANQPISIAYSSIGHAHKHVRMSIAISTVLEALTPGPLTVVCPVNESATYRSFAYKAIGSLDATIGVRISDSAIEREISGMHHLGITSTAIRDHEGREIRDFDAAVSSIRSYSKLAANGWYAIESRAGEFAARHSTVVRVTESGALEVIRHGDVHKSEIEKILDGLPTSAFRFEAA